MLKIYSLVFIVSSFLYACGGESGGQGANQPPVIQADGILVKPVPLSSIVTSTANILPLEQVELSSPVSGNVLEIYFQEGQQVKRGQLLVKIDDRAWIAQRRGLEARLSSAESDLNRGQSLLEIEGASQEDVDRLQSEVTNIQAQIEELQVMINLANVRAPFSGRVGMRNFSTGAFLAQGQIITRLVQTNKVRIDFTLPARYSSLIKEGQEITVKPSASNDTARAKVYAISPMLDVATRSLQVRAMLDNDDNLFMPGDFATVTIDVDQLQDALLVPSESIIPELNAHVVYKVENGRAKRQEVEVGIRTENSVHITRGIVEGDTVLVTGLLQIEDGDQVVISEMREGGAL
jgi:membrane fusion protein, multidrug efflux system